MKPLPTLIRQLWQALVRRPPPPRGNDDLVGVTAPNGPRPLRGGAHARPDPAKQR
ncbi:hypothetical protein [Deinococcus sp.]|uniref:hypothetical protein n=1 Tax=Deinococcus sp. TaxID=47478 RepID=UPI00286D72D6|nr:hypothetical protein [Deinococcus sp.]